MLANGRDQLGCLVLVDRRVIPVPVVALYAEFERRQLQIRSMRNYICAHIHRARQYQASAWIYYESATFLGNN